ncbi:DUF4395 family protein [Thiospirochaeta perfilievii]|uniref:DUF4395 family protein n=1 Tax=Thiospirochaeta perfilievii TaxID=252967 RepID=A0A5C1Q925_9SPIO|nr:DUF4395 family protein [Thiospirochaeta perfilievii]QEN04011.1 DUF4395 family protein [Thiospirochaeta perfilievii]
MIIFKYKDELDEDSVRAAALLCVILGVSTFISHSLVPLLVLLCDNIVSFFLTPKHSFLTRFSKITILPIANFRTKKISANAKHFALLLAIITESIIILFLFNGYILFANTLLFFLIFFALTETFLKFCIGYYIFNILSLKGFINEELSDDCLLSFNHNH